MPPGVSVGATRPATSSTAPPIRSQHPPPPTPPCASAGPTSSVASTKSILSSVLAVPEACEWSDLSHTRRPSTASLIACGVRRSSDPGPLLLTGPSRHPRRLEPRRGCPPGSGYVRLQMPGHAATGTSGTEHPVLSVRAGATSRVPDQSSQPARHHMPTRRWLENEIPIPQREYPCMIWLHVSWLRAVIKTEGWK